MRGQEESIGGIKVTRMIWTATLLSLCTIYYLRYKSQLENPSIMDTALQYPYTVYIRIAVMYSLFILFLVNLFIKWWIDSSQISTKTRFISICGTTSFIFYALFISTIDRERINYQIAQASVFVASITNIISLTCIFRNLSRIHEQKPYFIGYISWRLKKALFFMLSLAYLYCVAIYLGFADINDKFILEYVIVTMSYLFYWTFVFDLKGFKMDILDSLDVKQKNQEETIEPSSASIA